LIPRRWLAGNEFTFKQFNLMPNVSVKQLLSGRANLRKRRNPRAIRNQNPKLRKPVIVVSAPITRTRQRVRPAAPRRAPPLRPSKSTGWLSKILGVGGGALGGFLGGPAGAAAGSSLGSGAGALFTHITGMGAYKVNRNTLTNGQAPQFGDGTGTITFAHSEFLTDVRGSTAFTNTVIPINPGLFTSFPFLSALMVNFEQYEFLGLVFTFKSTSSNALNSTNTALGSVIMSTNYDTLDTTFTNKQQMDAYMFTTSCQPSMSMMHPVECAPRMSTLTNMYIRTGAVPTGADQRFYDLGNFQLATVGMQATAVIGELWVSYHVKMLKPKLPTPVGANLLGAHFTENPPGSSTSSAPFGSGVPILHPGSNLPVTTASGGNVFFINNPGSYLVAIAANVTIPTFAFDFPTLSNGTNITQNRILLNSINAVAAVENIPSEPTQYFISGMWLINVLAPGVGPNNVTNEILLAFPGTTSAGNADIIIQQMSSAITMDTTDKRRGAAIDELMERLDLLERRLTRPLVLAHEEKLHVEEKSYEMIRPSIPLRTQPAPVDTRSQGSRK
jgi:hypothetical protein